MKLKILLFFIILSTNVYSFAVTPTHLDFKVKDDFAKNEFIVINMDNYPINISIYSDENFLFYPSNSTIYPYNQTKIKVVIKEPNHKDNTIYINEIKESEEGFNLETLIGIKTSISYDKKILGEEPKEIDEYELVFTELNINNPSINQILRIDTKIENLKSPVLAYSTSEIYLDNKLINLIESEKQQIEDTAIITTYYNIETSGEYAIASKVRYHNKETDIKVINFKVNNLWFKDKDNILVLAVIFMAIMIIIFVLNKFMVRYRFKRI